MSLFSALLTTDMVPAWVSASFPVIRTIFICVLAISAIIIVITVLMQSNTSGGGTNVISGAQESYYAQNKGSSREGRLKKVTIIATAIMAVISILYAIMELIYSGY